MIIPIKDVLSSKKGIAEALGIMLIGLSVLVAVGVVVANYALLSKSSSQLQTLSQQITNRAEQYAGEINTDLTDPVMPPIPTTPVCSTTPAMCTTILPTDPTTGAAHSATAEKIVLRITGDLPAGILGQSLTKDVTLVSSEVTHVTALDENGKKVWGVSDEGLRYKVWGLASGDPTTVRPEDMAGPGIGASWVSVADRAGIDSSGALWVWGKNNIGQAGVGSVTTTPVTPKKIDAKIGSVPVQFRSVVTTDDRAYAIDSTGAPWVWGKNDKGQLGVGTTTNVTAPTRITGTRMMTFAVGKDNVIGITMAGELAVSGVVQPGLTTATSSTLVKINPGTRYKAVAATTAGAVALIDSAGKLTVVGASYPFTPLTSGIFTSVTLGSTSGYAMGTNSRIYSFGLGANGQLGLGAVTSASTPTAIAGTFAAVSGGKTSAFAIDVSGKLHYFGKTPAGAVSGAELPQVSVPTALLPESRFRGIAANATDTSVALLDTSGNVYGMGTAIAGLWPMNYLGPNNQPIRMPVPDGFPSYTWG